jgi:hypothetical protein
MTEEPKRRRIPIELVLGGLAVLICLGALLGPGIYRRIVVGRIVKRLGGSLSWADRRSLRELMDLDWPEADAAIGRLAAESPTVAYLPQSKTMVSAAKGLKFTRVVPGEGSSGFFNAESLECYVHRGGSFSGKLVGARVVELSSSGEEVQICFRLDDAVSDRLKHERGAQWQANLTVKQLRRVAGGGETVLVDYDTKSEKAIWKQVLAGLDPLLTGAGISARADN